MPGYIAGLLIAITLIFGQVFCWRIGKIFEKDNGDYLTPRQHLMMTILIACTVVTLVCVIVSSADWLTH